MALVPRRRPRTLLLTVVLALGVGATAAAQSPEPKPPSNEQKSKEFQRLVGEVTKAEAAGKLDDAAAAAEKLLAYARMTYGDTSNTAEILKWLASLHERREDFAAAGKAHSEALTLSELLYGKDHWKTTDARLRLRYAEFLAAATEEQRRRLREADGLVGRARQLAKEGKAKEAVGPAQQALALRTAVLGEDHPRTAAAAAWLGSVLTEQGSYARAELLYRRVLEVQKQALGEAHPDYAKSLNSLANVYIHQGDYTRSEPPLRQASEIFKQALGEAHPDYATSLNNLAALYLERGDYARAEPLCRLALDVRRKALGEAHAGYAASLHNLAGLYLEQGDYARAEPLYRRATEIRKQALGEGHPDYADSLFALAHLYKAQGDYARAEPLYRRASDIDKQALGEDHPKYAASLFDLAALYGAQGDYASAEPLYRQASDILKKALGEGHPHYAGSLNNLALLYEGQGDYARAEPLLRRASDIYKKALGEAHPEYVKSLSNLAVLYRRQGDYVRAEPLARQSLVLTRDHLDATAAIQSERQQLRMADLLRNRLDFFLAVALDAKTPFEQVTPFLLQAKGAVFVRQRRQRQLLELAARDGEAARAAADLDQTARHLATLAGRTPQPAQRDAWKKELAELTEKQERLEADLSRLSADFRTGKSRARLTPEQLRDRLPADVALVDLFEYTHFTPDPKNEDKFLRERRLLAVVLRKDRAVALVPLGAARPVADAVDAWRLTLKRTQPVLKSDDPAVVLRDRLWQPLTAHLEGAKTVLISPDGVLAQLPFAALPGSKPGTYLIEEVNLAVIPVPQLLAELLDRKPEEAGGPSLLLVGAVDYDAEPGKAASGAAARTGARSGERKQWRPLDGTRTEMAAIKDSFEQRFPDGKVRALRGAGATEEALRELAPRHRWLHLATHGFFAPPTVKAIGRADDKGPRGVESLGERDVTGWHPGLLSGLALAGANREPDPERDDGILTALEVQALDLSKVEMAVLSACETGLGRVAGGEGVLGLQRAFQVAGARSVVASLWSVDDKATQQLMVRFYENRWDRKMATLEALTEAQRWMLAEGLKRGLVREDVPQADGKARTPPYYWAAFVLSGDWR